MPQRAARWLAVTAGMVLLLGCFGAGASSAAQTRSLPPSGSYQVASNGQGNGNGQGYGDGQWSGYGQGSQSTIGPWSAVPTPFPSTYGNGGNAFNGVSCAGPPSCLAVGISQQPLYILTGIFPSPTVFQQIAAIWNDSAWTALAAPVPPGATATTLNSVSCVSTAWCMAVGQYQTSNSDETAHTLIEAWNGRSLTVVPSPDVGGMAAVSCTRPTFCVAVGGSSILQWNGYAWMPSPLVGATSTYILSGVSCVLTFCEIGGAYNVPFGSNSPNSVLLAVRNDPRPGPWTVKPGAPGVINGRITAISCYSETLCMAVGAQENSAQPSPFYFYTLAELWNGSTWALQTTVNADSAFNYQNALNAVSCFGPASCVAGGYVDLAATSSSANVIEFWDGTTWALQATPSGVMEPPSGTTGGEGVTFDVVNGVSCVPNRECVAVGTARDAAESLLATVSSWPWSRDAGED